MSLLRLKTLIQSQQIPLPFSRLLEEFCESYLRATQPLGADPHTLHGYLEHYIELVGEQIRRPHFFDIFHQKITVPVDYHQFGLELMRPLISFKESKVVGLEHVKRMDQQVRAGENVILLANHQTEPDPQILYLLLEPHFPLFASEIIFIAGDRVTTDPLAVPFTMGCHILSIYSKRRIEHPPELKAEKQLHNQRTMRKMRDLLEEGGKTIYVAPSGGRDRPNAEGKVEAAPFDAQSLEMFWLMAQQSKTPTHFYPLALSTYDILPPPHHIDPTIGERRYTKRSPAHAAFGEEISMTQFPGSDETDKKVRRQLRAEFIWQLVKSDYEKLT